MDRFALWLLLLSFILVHAHEDSRAILSRNPLPITPSFFHDRIPEMGETTSERIFEVLQQHGVLGKDGLLNKDPSHINWQMLFRKRQVLPVAAPGELKWEDEIDQGLAAAFRGTTTASSLVV